MVHRHPHVFGNEKFASLDDQLKAWEKLKKEEHQKEGKATGVFASLPRDLDPLARAYRIHSKAARTGFTWENDEDVERQVEAEWLEFLDAETRKSDAEVKHELGDLLFTIAELGRRHGMKANEALDYANERFLSRFKRMEALAAEQKRELTDMSLDEKNELWEQAKQEEKAAGTLNSTVSPAADAPLTKKTSSPWGEALPAVFFLTAHGLSRHSTSFRARRIPPDFPGFPCLCSFGNCASLRPPQRLPFTFTTPAWPCRLPCRPILAGKEFFKNGYHRLRSGKNFCRKAACRIGCLRTGHTPGAGRGQPVQHPSRPFP